MREDIYNYPQFKVLPPAVEILYAKTLTPGGSNLVVTIDSKARMFRIIAGDEGAFVRFGDVAASSADDEWDYVVPAGAIIDISIPKTAEKLNLYSAGAESFFVSQQ